MDNKTKNDLISFLWVLFCLGAFCGVDAFKSFLQGIKEIFLALFPTLLEFALDSYLSSPGFIVGAIILLLSFLGAYISRKTEKSLFKIVSIVLAVVSIFSFGKGVLY